MKPQGWLIPLTPLYAAAVAAKNAAYDHGLIRQKTLRGPVVSIGNLSTGGGGKTPFAIALAKLLTEAGIAVDVLSRGYGRSSAAVERVDASTTSTSDRFGDEPLLLAREAEVPVYVGAQRYQAGLLAEREAERLHLRLDMHLDLPPPLHLLDDGFQHRQLARDLDIVLLHRDDLRTRLLPAGHLREPLSSLRRADVVVMREEVLREEVMREEVLRKEDRTLAMDLRRYLHPQAVVWHIRREVKLASVAGRSLVFCGIARPEEFFAEVRALGAEIVDTLAFPDHHAFSMDDLRRIGERVKASGAVRILTTAKDLTRLPQTALETLQKYAPVESVLLTVTLLEPDEVLARVGSLRKR